MSSKRLNLIQHKDILTYEEIIRIVRIAARLGVRKIRITGGEPLIRKDVAFLVASIKKINGIEDLSITTNGILLERYAEELAEAGVDRVNISLDSLRAERYREITGGGNINPVLRGIEAAKIAGLIPIKINIIPLRGINDDEIKDFARITLNSDYHIRFIEFMPFGSCSLWNSEKHIPCSEVKSVIETIAPLTPVQLRKNGPARYFRFKGANGIIGFISAITHHFCKDCNRLRITSDGKLRPCLFSETEIDLRLALRGSAPDDEIERLLRLAIEVKPQGHDIRLQNTKVRGQNGNIAHLFKRPMSQIGG